MNLRSNKDKRSLLKKKKNKVKKGYSSSDIFLNPGTTVDYTFERHHKTGQKRPKIELIEQINNKSRWKNASTSSMRRRLCEAGLYARITVKKPLLKKQNNVKRLPWVKAHKD